MINVAKEKLVDCLTELSPLLSNHWCEVEHDKEAVPLNPDFLTYLTLEAEGNLMLVTARDNGEIVGYMWDIVAINLHYGKLYSVNDVLYVSPTQRGKGLLKSMCVEIEKHLVKAGAVVRTMNIKYKGSSTVCGYTPVELVYHKNLIGV